MVYLALHTRLDTNSLFRKDEYFAQHIHSIDIR